MEISKAESFFSIVLLFFIVSGCSIVGWRSTKEAPYELMRADGAYELRRYSEAVAVETVSDKIWDEAVNGGFKLLFNYISGENNSGQRISMTAPVIVTPSGSVIAPSLTGGATSSQNPSDRWKLSFILPADLSFEKAPSPTSSELTVRLVPAGLRVSYKFSGTLGEEELYSQSQNLINWASGQGLRPISSPYLAGYDPPWTLPFLRRNELLMDVELLSSKS